MSQIRTLNVPNAAPLSKTSSQSSDYFDDDPEFAEALATLDDSELFGSQPLACLDNLSNNLADSGARASQSSSQGRKRKRSVSPLSGQENSQEDMDTLSMSNEQPSLTLESSAVDNTSKLRFPTTDPGVSATPSDTYDASKFGGFGDYFRRKRAKRQIREGRQHLAQRRVQVLQQWKDNMNRQALPVS